jgi:hypothetical protein
VQKHPLARVKFCMGFVALSLAIGCSDAIPAAVSTRTIQNGPPISFDAASAATIRGQVTWRGEIPQVAEFEVLPNFVGGEIFHKKRNWPNPNAPLIDASSKGISGAVVFLRGIESSRSKPWDHGPVTIEQRDGQFHIVQDGVDSPCGFVRRGDRVSMISRDSYLYGLHAGGVEYFSLTFPAPGQPRERTLNRCGLVELSSGIGYFWMRAYLFVDDHPYYARTDRLGNFTLTGVPPGNYELVCWLPSWREARHDRDPESRLISRLTFQPATELRRALTLGSRETRQAPFSFSLSQFSRENSSNSYLRLSLAQPQMKKP